MSNSISHLKDQLNSSGVFYELIRLPEDLEPDVASHVAFHRISFQDAVPTIVYKTEKGLVAVQRRADTKFTIQKLKDFLGVQVLEFAGKEDLEKIGSGAGIVPLTGLSIPYYMDKKVLEQGEIYGGANHKLFALKIRAKDLVKLNKAQVGDFTEMNPPSFSKENFGGARRVYGGMRATGRLHLGNYLGGAKGMLALQDTYDCIFTVVDLHVLTTPLDNTKLKQQVRDVILDYLSVGLNPEKCRIEIQSHIPQHTELAYLLSTVYPLAPLQDLPTFKEKAAQYPKIYP